MTATLRLMSSMAPREALAAAIACYRSIRPVLIEAVALGGVEVARRVAAGEPVDMVVLSDDAIGALIDDGQLLAASRVDLMTSKIAVAVPTGAARADLATAAAVKAAVVAAPTLSYSTGPSGRYLEQLFARWGILEAVRSRIIVPPPGVPVARLVASGEAKLGFQQLSELLDAPGIEVLGPLPEEIQHATRFTAALTPRCADREAARDFLSFVASSRCDALKARHGMG